MMAPRLLLAEEVPVGQVIGDDHPPVCVLQGQDLFPGDPLLDPCEEAIIDILLDPLPRLVVVEIVERNMTAQPEAAQCASCANQRDVHAEGAGLDDRAPQSAMTDS